MLNTMYKGKRMTALEYLKISKVVNDPSHIIVNEIPLFSARYADLYKYKYKQFNLRGTNSIFQPSNEQNQNKKKNTDPIQIESWLNFIFNQKSTCNINFKMGTIFDEIYLERQIRPH